jgi:hypothetical protein
MATLNIGGVKVKVSDEFLSMSPEQQAAAVEEIATSLQTQPQPQPGNAPPSPAYDEALAAGSQASQRFAGAVAPRDQQAQPMGPDLMGATAATLGGMVNGIPVIGPMAQNVSDALVGGASALTGGDYGETVEGLRARREGLAAANPVASVAGNLAGGIGAYGALAKTAGGAAALGLEGGLAARVGNSAASGAAISATDAAFKGGDLENVIGNAVIGGGIGAATPPIASGLGAAARAIGNRFAPTIAGATNPAEEGARRAGQVFIRDAQANPTGIMSAADEAAAQRAGIPLMNVDRGGETTRALARSVANQNPEARATISKAVDSRFESQGLRATDLIRRVAGGSVDDIGYQQAIREQAAIVNAPRYKAAFEAPQARAVWTPQIRQLMQSPQFRAAVNMAEKRGADKAAISGFKAVKNPFVFGADGSINLKVNADGSRALPSLAFWNQVKINLDGMIERAQRGAKPDRSLYADLTQMKNMLVGDLDAAVPAYRTARQGAAGFFGADDALQAGKTFANQPRNVPEAQRAFAKFNDAEKSAFRTGYASELIDRIRATRDRVNVVNQVFGNQASREMMQTVFGPARAREIEAYVRVENLADMMRGALGNSTTARQLVELGIGTGVGGLGGLGLSGGNWGAAAQGAALGAGAAGAKALGQRIDAKVMQEVARILTSSNPKDLQKAIYNASMSPKWMDAIKALEEQLQIGTRAALMPTGS